MIEGSVFIGAVVVGITEFIKRIADRDWRGATLIVLAALVGLFVSVFAVYLGVAALSIAKGIMIGLAAAGVYQVARQIG